MKNIFLIGPMGSGKTSLGRRIAPGLGLQFIDLDEELERRCGVEVAIIFEIEGEQGFREREQNLLAEVASRSGQLIATGGGSVLAPANRQTIKANGVAVWLKTSVDQQLARLKRDKRRPLLAAPNRRQRLMSMAEQRDPVYASLADVVFESRNRPVNHMAQALERTIRCYLKQGHQPACLSSN
ncbi:MAG: shikimate kinase [Wenzhouxiangellaceae bacterium]|nr:shikimate kinase [Wenzhouxiangellaceae bacterium]